MKTTLEIPDSVLRAAKIRAAQEGTTLRAIVCRALEAELSTGQQATVPAWQRHFGALRHLQDESANINGIMEDAFGRVDEDAWS